jgi:hypothetical protein
MAEQDKSTKSLATTCRVFISYSHDSLEHQKRVLALANQLRKDGVEAWIDQYTQDPNEGWIRWMRNQVKQANRVLLVFTETYQRRFEGNEEEGKGVGATFEGVIVTQELYETGGSNAKFRPVVFSEQEETFIPEELRRFNRYRVDTQDNYQNLLRWLCEAPRIVPPILGIKQNLPPESAPELFPRDHAAQQAPEGIRTPSRPAPRPEAQEPVRDPVDGAIAKILQLLKSGNVTYFLGPGSCYGRTDSLPRSCDITRQLLAELELISPSYDQLLPPVDIAGMYYAVSSCETNLENKVTEIFSQSPRDIPPTHRCLAALLQVLAQRPPRRGRYPTQQLIVTTSLDIMMERALLSAGISFTRIVQHRSGKTIDMNEYRAVQLVGQNGVRLDSGVGPTDARLDCVEELDQVIADCRNRRVDIGEPSVGSTNALHGLALQEYTEPILYKFLGSYDVPRSCTLSTEQHFELAQRQNCIPAKVLEIIANSPALFLGHSLLDPDFRLASYTLLRKFGKEPRYAVLLPPERHPGDIYRQMESHIWTQIKECGSHQFRIATLELEGDLFLERLTSKLRAQLGISA